MVCKESSLWGQDKRIQQQVILCEFALKWIMGEKTLKCLYSASIAIPVFICLDFTLKLSTWLGFKVFLVTTSSFPPYITFDSATLHRVRQVVGLQVPDVQVKEEWKIFEKAMQGKKM